MQRQKRKASGFDQSHTFWPKALELWQRGYSNAQVASEAQGEGYDFTEDQVRYARSRFWSAEELPARGAKWLRQVVRQATEVYPSALEQQQALFSENYEVFIALKRRLLTHLNGGPTADGLELAQLKVLLDALVRPNRRNPPRPRFPPCWLNYSHPRAARIAPLPTWSCGIWKPASPVRI